MTLSNNPPRFTAPIAEQIWDMKYRLKDADGTVVDEDVTQTWFRIAEALAAVENHADLRAHGATDGDMHEENFYRVLEDFKYLPAGRITAGAGTGRAVTLFNCFVMGTVPDNMGGIFDMLKEAALTMQQGGGIGYDFSTIRPKGAAVKGVAADASGPLSFMDVWDAMCRTIMSAGSRRGAMMATMRCDHPDVADFITAKHDAARMRMFNMSVLITDPFMAAVKADEDWDLIFEGEVYHTVRASDLWDSIMQSTYDYAEPGVIFIDRINAANNLRAVETISATNPCGEQPLPPYGACLLGSMNYPKYVIDPFGPDARIDTASLQADVATAVRMMDNVVDASRFPLAQQQVEAKNKRRIGLGYTGLASALAMLKVKYGSQEAQDFTAKMGRLIDHAAYAASVDLAIEKGSFPLFDADEFLAEGTHASTLPDSLKDRIREHGIRNALLTSIAPTGTISLYAGNVSSGIEPIFAFSYTRKVLQKDGSRTEEVVEDYAVRLYREMWDNQNADNGVEMDHSFDDWDVSMLPDYFVSAQTLPPLAHVKMQAAAQKHVDSSISKTINCPEDISFDDFKEVYMAAWDSGCKGCTTYRPNDVTGSVLSVDTEESVRAHEGDPDEVSQALGVEAAALEHFALGGDSPLPNRAAQLCGSTYKIKWPNSDHAMYVTINDEVQADGSKRPYEIFINSKDMENYAWIVGMTRMVSAIFRRPHDSSFVVEELKAVFDPRGGAWLGGKFISSELAAIGGIIGIHMQTIGYGPMATAAIPLPTGVEEVDLSPNQAPGSRCSKCGEFTLLRIEGCETCTSCLHAKCG